MTAHNQLNLTDTSTASAGGCCGHKPSAQTAAQTPAADVAVPARIELPSAHAFAPTVQRISGHKTLAMVARYAHQSGEHIAAAMERLEERVTQELRRA